MTELTEVLKRGTSLAFFHEVFSGGGGGVKSIVIQIVYCFRTKFQGSGGGG